MKILSIIGKSIKEQLRSYWILLLTIFMGPFFISVYFLIVESSKSNYRIIIINNDQGITADGQDINHGNYLVSSFKDPKTVISENPFIIRTAENRDESIEKIKDKKADALIIIDSTFSQALEKRKINDTTAMPAFEFMGDLTNTSYLLSAVWANEIINEYALHETNSKSIVKVKETALGTSGEISMFDMVVPGILILSLIMLMFPASIAFVAEVENKTIIRLKLSKLTTTDFLFGAGTVQLLVGIISVLLTLVTAITLGFEYEGSLAVLFVVACLAALSIIAFSLIIAGVTKATSEILVVGNFPMFLFMFFTGAAFPLKSKALFTIAGYPVNLQGLMSPTHAISALNKTLIMDMNITQIIPEIISVIVLIIIYFLIGAVIFKRRHLRLT